MPIAAQILLLTTQQEIVPRLTTLFNSSGVSVRHVSEAHWALDELKDRHYPAVLVDCSVSGSWEVLDSLRLPGHYKLTVFALVANNDQSRKASAAGANFLISQPINWDIARRTVRAAQAMLVRDRRRGDREPVQGTAFMSFIPQQEIPVAMQELSEGGMSVQAPRPMAVGDEVFIRFELPGTDTRIQSQCRVTWAKDDGVVGLKFAYLPENSRQDIKQWFIRHRQGRSAAES